MKITVVGLGYVGLSNAAILSRNNKVIAFDIDDKRVEMINNRLSPIKDSGISDFLKNNNLNLEATTNKDNIFTNADYIIIATPTDYDDITNHFNTETVESIIEEATKKNPKSMIIIKSTIPVGFVNKMRKKFNSKQIIFSPEFLREGYALHDNLYPSRIVVGEISARAKVFAKLLLEGTVQKDAPILLTSPLEAESIKLFANSYLAMRVSFFNELDSYSFSRSLNTKQIIEGVSLDPRIGDGYNNPSFGYGGYCLPKDTKQLLSNFDGVPQNLIKAIIDSNKTRKEFICNQLLSQKPKTIGVYRLAMKFGSDNFRQSAILDILKELNSNGISIIIYEPLISNIDELDYKVESDFEIFKKESDLIISNRMDNKLIDIKHKVFTRDIYNRD
jgi:UDPglucose 6-dehydrogenase